MDLSLTLLTVFVAFLAGLIRGFSGFGGPASILAILTWFMTPMQVIGKILVIEFVAASFLLWRARNEIEWRTPLLLTIPTLISMPFGQLILQHTEPVLMGKIIAAAIFFSSAAMLSNVRYRQRLGRYQLMALGLVSGIIIGASYVALVSVTVILMGPYSRHEARSLIIAWGFSMAVWYLFLSVINGNTGIHEILAVIPAGIAYFSGSWIGANRFLHSTEESYRRYALLLLISLALIGMLR